MHKSHVVRAGVALILAFAYVIPARAQDKPDPLLKLEQSRGSTPYRDAFRRYLNKELPKIINGKLAKAGDYPWQVSLGAAKIPNSLYAHFCGGSIYSPTIIVTAAHCVVGNDPSDIVVTAGTLTLGEGDMRRYVSRIILRGDYSSKTQDNDIALLELSEPLTLTPGRVASIPLLGTAEEAASLPVNAPLVVTGWGVTKETGKTASRHLQYAELPFVSRQVCNGPLANNGAVTDSMLCAGYSKGGIDACYGDSGGALAVSATSQPKLAGIVSWGEGCAHPQKYGVYTRVPVFASWVAACAAGQAGCKKE